MIWHEHVSSIATTAEKEIGYLFKARNHFSPSNLLTLYKVQVRPSLKYCSHIWGAAAPTTLSILDAVQRRAIRLIGDPALTCPSSRFLNGVRMVSSFSHRACKMHPRTSSPHPKAIILHALRTERYKSTFVPGVSRACNGLTSDVFIEPGSVGLFKSHVNKLPLT
nr:unnamed protein product [Callosobruchus chinensis]